MPTCTLSSGEVLSYADPAPDVAAYLERVRVAAADPRVSEDDMILLIYNVDNPIMDKELMPGRGAVTVAVMANPIYHVMTHYLEQKEIQRGLIDPAAAAACYTVSVNDAAEQLGITPSAVRAAIKARKIPAHLRNGQWYTRAEGIAFYKVSNRGRSRGEVAGNGGSVEGKTGSVSPPTTHHTPPISPVWVRIGGEPGRSMALRVTGGELIKDGPKGSRHVTGHLSAEWTRALVKVSGPTAEFRVFVLEPVAPPCAIGEVIEGSMYVRGAFRVVETHNNLRAAKAVWAAAQPEQAVSGVDS